MTRKALRTKDGTTYRTMLDIRFCALTMDGRSITTKDTYIMEHGRLFEKLRIDMELRMSASYQQATIGDLPTMV